jgi:hypothetical protein
MVMAMAMDMVMDTNMREEKVNFIYLLSTRDGTYKHQLLTIHSDNLLNTKVAIMSWTLT